MQDCLTVAILIMFKMSPDVKQNVFQLLQDIEEIQPVNFKYNMNQWLLKMETTCTSIKKKIPNVYHKDQYLMDLFNGALQVP